MMNLEDYRQCAVECLHRAESEVQPEDKNILLNIALAWVRLAHQSQSVGIVPDAEPPADDPTNDIEAEREEHLVS